MSSLNARTTAPQRFTAEGAPASKITTLQELLRLTMACMLWEDGFYESGKLVADRIKELVHMVPLERAAAVAIEARGDMKLRHVPLLIVREMARHPQLSKAPRLVGETLARIIQRPDELSEFMAIYWKDGKTPISKQVKLGLAKAFQKFNEYQLAKYNRKKDIMLRDVLFLVHGKPKDVTDHSGFTKDHRRLLASQRVPESRTGGFSEGELLYGKLVYDQLATPDTWEVELSANGNTAEAWVRLLNENKLGDLAFLRNLRNMVEKGVDKKTIVEYGDKRSWGRVLPFRFIAAARVVPQLEPDLERWMFKCLDGAEKMHGKTILLVDVSGSMDGKLSAKSDLTRLDAADALAMLLREICDDVQIVTFSNQTIVCPPRRGFALRDSINHSQPHGVTYLGKALDAVKANFSDTQRLIVITDEQSYDPVASHGFAPLSYMLNVASNRNGVGYGGWLRVDGFSETIVSYIQKYESTTF